MRNNERACDSKLPRDYIFFVIETLPPFLSLGVFPMDYTINGVYTRNRNQYCPIAIMPHRNCRYTMQLLTTRRTCQERNEGDQWIFNCQYGMDSRQNFEIMPARCIIDRRYFLLRIITSISLSLSSVTCALMRFRILTINLRRQVASMSRITLLR